MVIEDNRPYTIAGIMSGTSLDGLDLVLCTFQKNAGRWLYEILKAETIGYPETWRRKLTSATELDTIGFLRLHNEYGEFIGNQVLNFISTSGRSVDLVSSHGHTIFHQPENKLTFQLGSGAAIAATCRISTVSDFRINDIALGGQGAPLVPIGDELLFSDYRFCLNIGGFANISHREDSRRVACDLCPVNIVVNNLAQRIGLELDKDGSMGRNGKIIPPLVDELNALEFYLKTGPKSLGREWVEERFLPVIDRYENPLNDLMRSVYEHIAVQISTYINSFRRGEVLVTGGGAYNRFLIELISQKLGSTLVIPEKRLVEFKEALVFGFLGLLRARNEVNCIASVTGASSDSSSGVIIDVLR